MAVSGFPVLSYTSEERAPGEADVIGLPAGACHVVHL